ncbi:MAG: phenylalanine--tRNA ligase beta subunit-related protein, partial [Candidatus Saccharimonadaceae bacterium]
MKVSLNTIEQYIDIDLGVDELVERINQQLGQVEGVIDLGTKYKDVVVVKVVECDKHPNADKLSVCKVDDGGVVADVPRDEKGLVQVVCGAPNARVGIFAAWLPPKSTVPASFSDKEPFVLDARELRGVLSQGMLAAPDELAIGTGHDGILEITEDDLPKSIHQAANQNLRPGAKFAELFGLNDTIIDIENKMFTHRPDCFGQLGVAREISAILKGLPMGPDDVDTRFVNPDWYWQKPVFASGEGLNLTVFNDTPEKSPRFMAVAIKNVEIKPSPLWLQIELVRLGSKAINNVVDITNYMMLLTAQPSHAYDYD